MNRWREGRRTIGLLGCSGVVLTSLLLFSIPADSDELRKFQLPSQKNAPIIRNMQEPPVYRRFRNDTRSWTVDKKNAMIASLEKKVDAARKTRNFSQIQHYSKLIQILQER
ncbi:MAG: hypothetical protein NPIRA02_24970 [Nitrospirales bacterium]|nr:MAG: hypothetical protein NPIRA02_24970 [Nitrospirales bacterium]